MIGFAIVAIVLYLGPVTGAALNPARAFGPELVTMLVKPSATHRNQYLPVYLAGPFAGTAVAAHLYDFLAKPADEKMPITAAVTEATERGHAAASSAAS